MDNYLASTVTPDLINPVKAYCRIKPSDENCSSWILDETSICEDKPVDENQQTPKMYKFEHCIGPVANNRATYEIILYPIVEKVKLGYNGTLFACEYIEVV